jgi:chromosomal replication initiator protein
VLISKDQRLRLSLPRQVAFYLLRNEAGCSLPEIATYMERDHTTVMYGIDRVQNLLATNDNTAEHLRLRIESIRQRVRKGAAA